MHLEVPELPFLSLFTTVVPYLPPSNSKILFIINTDTSHMSLFNQSKTVRARDMNF